MKKMSILFALSFVANSAFAQLKVFPSGNISVATSSTSDPGIPFAVRSPKAGYALSALGTQNGIYGKASSAYQSWAIGVNGESHDIPSSYMCGVMGNSLTSSAMGSGRSYGVMGIAGNAAAGYNYGVFGRLDGSCSGAAVYGTTTYSDNGIFISGRYAGYFRGATKVDGALTVSGTINGVVLGASSGQSADNQDMLDDQGVSLTERLSNLRASTFYLPEEALPVTSESDTANVVPAISPMEAQVRERVHYGLDEEGLVEAFPELVYKQENGTIGINYVELIPVLVQTINELNARVQELEGVKGKSKARSQRNTVELGNAVAVTSSVKSIAYTLPKDVREASLVICDASGKQLRSIELSNAGKHELELNVDGLQNGIYLYSLVSEGNVLATKKMVVKN